LPLEILLRRPHQNLAPNLPLQQHQITIAIRCRRLLGGVDAGFQVWQPVGYADW